MGENNTNLLVELLKSSTLEQRQEAQAIAKFVSKLMALSPETPLEEQMSFLEDYYADREERHNRNEMAPYMVKYIDNISHNYYARNKDSFAQLEEKDPYAIVAGLVAAVFIISSDNTKLDEKVFNLYHDYIENYRSYVEEFIVNNDRYDLTKNQEDTFKKYLNFKKDFKESQKDLTIGQVFGTIRSHIDKYIPVIKEFQKEGLDKDSVDFLITEILLKQYSMVAFGLSQETIQKVGPIQGLSDASSIKNYIAAGEKISSELELNESQTKTFERITSTLQRMIPASTGCLGVLIALICFSASVVGLISWGISSLFA